MGKNGNLDFGLEDEVSPNPQRFVLFHFISFQLLFLVLFISTTGRSQVNVGVEFCEAHLTGIGWSKETLKKHFKSKNHFFQETEGSEQEILMLAVP